MGWNTRGVAHIGWDQDGAELSGGSRTSFQGDVFRGECQLQPAGIASKAKGVMLPTVTHLFQASGRNAETIFIEFEFIMETRSDRAAQLSMTSFLFGQ